MRLLYGMWYGKIYRPREGGWGGFEFKAEEGPTRSFLVMVRQSSVIRVTVFCFNVFGQISQKRCCCQEQLLEDNTKSSGKTSCQICHSWEALLATSQRRMNRISHLCRNQVKPSKLWILCFPSLWKQGNLDGIISFWRLFISIKHLSWLMNWRKHDRRVCKKTGSLPNKQRKFPKEGSSCRTVRLISKLHSFTKVLIQIVIQCFCLKITYIKSRGLIVLLDQVYMLFCQILPQFQRRSAMWQRQLLEWCITIVIIIIFMDDDVDSNKIYIAPFTKYLRRRADKEKRGKENLIARQNMWLKLT